jgi:ribosomal protein S18 acetylase RimI-like enzyme
VAEPVLREAARADIAALASLAQDTYIETFGMLYRPEDLAAFFAEVLSEAAIAAEMEDPRVAYRVVEADRRLIGYCKLGPVKVPVEPAEPALELRQLYLRQSAQGRGLGDALMAWALEEARARGARLCYLSVYSENQRAQRFYRRHGFQHGGEYRFMVGEQADREFWWWRRLDAA